MLLNVDRSVKCLTYWANHRMDNAEWESPVKNRVQRMKSEERRVRKVAKDGCLDRVKS
jgi:hypothetical protein